MARRLLPIGITLAVLAATAYGTWAWLAARHQVSTEDAYVEGAVGMGLVFVPLTTMALTAVSSVELPTASGLFNVVRNVGGSVGIALTTTWLSRQTQVHMATLIGHVTPWSAATADRLARLQDVYVAAGADADTARRQALRHLYEEVQRQASMNAFADDFLRLAALFVVMVPLVWGMRRPSDAPRPQPVEAV